MSIGCTDFHVSELTGTGSEILGTFTTLENAALVHVNNDLISHWPGQGCPNLLQEIYHRVAFCSNRNNPHLIEQLKIFLSRNRVG